MMEYKAKITKQVDGGFLVSFPDLEGCMTEGRTLERARNNAKEALDAYLASLCDRNLNLPKPKDHSGRNYHPITVDICIAFAIRLRQLRANRGLTQSQVAKRLRISQQAYAKLETPDSNPSLETIKRLSLALEVDADLRLGA